MTADQRVSALDSMLARAPGLSREDQEELRGIARGQAFAWYMLGTDIEHAFIWLYARADKDAYPGPMYGRAWLVLIFFVIPSMLIPAALLVPMNAGVLYPVAILAPLTLAIIGTRLIANRSSSPEARSKRGSCRGCGYDLRGLDDAIVFPAEIADPPSSGPERCPECGRRWPLLV